MVQEPGTQTANSRRIKSVEQSIADTDEPGTKLRKDLNWWDLTVFGVSVVSAQAFHDRRVDRCQHEDGIQPGTRWDDIPEDWSCPDCGAAKTDCEMVEVARP